MNDQHVKSTVDKVKGKVNEEVGHITGNNKQEAQGIGQQVLGKIEKVAGDVKDAVKQGVDKILKH